MAADGPMTHEDERTDALPNDGHAPLDALRYWERLRTPNPQHTARFRMGKGFEGTAVDPVFNLQLMTEVFGPCGGHWGIKQPEFRLQPGAEGELLVFCSVEIWYCEPDQGLTTGRLYGEGGDKIIRKTDAGLRNDDDACKKAYTDAVQNALKFLGVMADVYLGRFDDTKYVQEARSKYGERPTDAGSVPPPSRPLVPDMTRPAPNGVDQPPPRKSSPPLTRMFAALRQYGTAHDMFKAYMYHRWNYTSSTQLTAAEIQEVMRMAPHGPSAFQIPAAATPGPTGPQPGDPWHAAWNDLHTVCRNAEFNLARVRAHLCERFQVAEVQQIPMAQLREFTRLVITDPKDEGLSIPERDALSQPVETQ